MISEALLTLPQILAKMDIALVDEIKAQSRKSGTHVAVNGTFVAEQSQQYLYTFTLLDPWEPQDDTPFKVKFGSAQEIQGVIVTSTGTTITIATEEPLPPEALDRISLVDDPTQLLERLRDALKSNEEGSSRLGSKCFGLLPFTTGKRQSPVAFGGKFKPDNSQERAIQLALGSEVTYIVGPPGTGKTSTLAAIAFAHLIEGHTVLIAAHTNIAVDNAIMRLVDICKGANASNELRDGHIIRYGNPQLEARLKSEYSEVHLPTVVKHRVGDLSQRRKELQSYLDQVSAQLTTMNQEKTSLAEQWNLDRQSLVAHRDAHKNELILLQAREQQRISALDAQLQDLFHQLTQTQQHANIIRQRLAQIVAQQVQQQTVRSEHFTHINDLTTRLAAAQNMSTITRFFRRIDTKNLAQQLADRQQQLWYCGQRLAELQRQMNEVHHVRATAESQVEQLASTYRHTIAQRSTPSIDAQKIEKLQAIIARYHQYIASGDSRLRHGDDDMKQKQCLLCDEQEHVREQMAAIDKQLADVEKNIVAEAQIVATTLCKTYMNSNLRERRFDIVILDEVSMAPLPAVYVSASRANRSVVAIGDPRQLAPIFMAETSPAAKDWLGRDLFDFRNISLEDAAKGYSNSTLLEQQARMHPSISSIARKHVYRELIRDRPIDTQESHSVVRPLPGRPLLLCDTGDGSPVTTKPEGGSRINVYHALCTLEIARQVLASLPPPKRRLHAGEFRVGLVTPYRKQAELLQHLILDAGLKDSVRAGTVHRFQGLEAEVIIFDTVESPPLSPPEFTSGQWGSKAMRLVNVAVTRAQHKLIVLANSQYIQTNFYENDMLRLAVQEAQKADVIKSRDVLSILSPPPSNIGRSPLQNHGYKKEGKDTPPATSYIYEPEFLDDRTFYERFLQDVQSAEKQVVIFSPFLSLHRAKQIAPLLSERCRMGVRITVITSTLKPTDGEVATLLKKAGVELRTASGMHEKLVFIDEKIVYTGSLNVLSHGGTTEFIERVKSPKFAKKLRQFKNIDAVVEAPLQWGPSVMVFRHELPKTTTNCKKCGKPLTPIVGGYGAFYGCTDYRNSGCDYTEEVSESHLNGIQRIVNMRCSRCGERTRVKTNRKDAWLVCAAPISCGYGQRIAYSK